MITTTATPAAPAATPATPAAPAAETSAPADATPADAAAAPAVSDAPKEEEKKTETPESPKSEAKSLDELNLAARFAALDRKNKALLEREKSLKAQAERIKQAEEVERLAKEDPLAALERLGLTYEALTEKIISSASEPTPEEKVAQLVDAKLAAAREAEAKERAARDKAAYEETVNNYKRTMSTMAEQSGERFELVQSLGEIDLAWEIVDQAFAKTGQIMLPEKALELAEKALLERLSGVKKLRPPPAPEPVVQAPSAPAAVAPTASPQTQSTVQAERPALSFTPIRERRGSSFTLTPSTGAANAVGGDTQPRRLLTDEERLERNKAILRSFIQ